ncbi:bifunctional adenosylcobinamide kinase/adenosylcobinamide-phosphate guanylyltransferase [Aquabacterium sp.]|uniref:bifunctional adenosylcobinamide kinase/adenosylcobinamide-phosphate guanylyltransferase n=1 Tax=Aquabacterium sp. TaxID=1872578 RepID=UPI0035AE85CD
MSDHHLIVGGQRSGKSRHAERLAQQWLAASPGHRVTVVATATAWDDEMRVRIARHQADRPSEMSTVEEPRYLSRVLREHAVAGQLLLVDCLTLWLTNWLMPAEGLVDLPAWRVEREALLATLSDSPSPVIFVSNEVGWGVIPLSREVRVFVDELGRLNQDVAQRCAELTLMVAGQPWTRAVTAS